MWKYEYNDELYHYGVKGMEWGVHRASRQLNSARDSGERDKAISKLSTHRSKATNKLQKLDRQHVKLQNKRTKQIERGDVKAAKLNAKATKLRKKKYGRFVSKDKADELEFKANKLSAKADRLKARSDVTKAKIEKNRRMAAAFEQGIKDIDKTISDSGKRWVNKQAS